MRVEDAEALRGEEGQALLAMLPPYDEGSVLALGERLRREGHPPGLVAAALTQARLRARAHEKLGSDAARMLLTPEGLEQATRSEVARRRAERYRMAGAGEVVDLCCGIGSDLVALARAGLRTTGVDRDPVAVRLARANAEALGLADRVEVREDDVENVDTTGYAAAFCDPARRSGGRRTIRPEEWSPPWPYLERLLTGHEAAGAKVAPGIPHELVPSGVEAEWTSVGGEVVEAALWGGRLADPTVHRRATVLPARPTAGTVPHGVTDADLEGEPPVGPPARWLFEPDGAVVRAGLVGAVAARVGGHLIDPAIAYVCTDADVTTPLASRYEVVEVMPFQLKRLRAALRARDVGTVVVKKRGSAVDPDALRRQLRLSGSASMTLVLTRIGTDPFVLLTNARP